jgi:hypothetical protein
MALMGISGCSKNSECELLMAKLFASRPYEFVSGECIDAKNAYLYPSKRTGVLMFISVSKDTFVTDSIIDFNNSFAKYANMEEVEQAIASTLDSLEKIGGIEYVIAELVFNTGRSPFGKYSVKTSTYPVIYRKKDSYRLVTNNSVYKISFQNKEFTQILEYRQIPTKYEFDNTDCKGIFFENYYINKENGKKVYPFSDINAGNRKKVYSFSEYTKIKLANSDIILYENDEIAVNVEDGYCLYVRKLNPEEDIAVFGTDCILKENCKLYGKLYEEEEEEEE